MANQQGSLPIDVKRPAREELAVEALSSELEGLAEELMAFLHCLNAFPEFTDEGVNATIVSFDGDLQVADSHYLNYRTKLKTEIVLGVIFAGLQRCVRATFISRFSS